MAPSEELKVKAEQAVQAAKQFSEIFYEYLDKKRHVISKLYMEKATLIWNGHTLFGKEAVVKFLEELPSTQHNISSLDSQPLLEPVIADQTGIIVTVLGTVRFHDNRPKNFYQTFILSSEDHVWKIVSDTHRFLES